MSRPGAEPASNPWTTLGSKIIYTTPWLRLREDEVITPDGSMDTYAVVEIEPSVGVVALTAEKNIVLVSQWRYVHKKVSLEIPTGGSAAGESALRAAQRELSEEAGLSADLWTGLGVIDNSNGSTTDVAHMFLAQGLRAAARPPHQDTEQARVVLLPFAEAVEKVMAGGITESVSVAAILKVARLQV